MATGQIWLQISTCSKVVKIDENGLKIKRNQTLSAVPIFWVKKCIKFKFKIFLKEEKRKNWILRFTLLPHVHIFTKSSLCELCWIYIFVHI